MSQQTAIRNTLNNLQGTDISEVKESFYSMVEGVEALNAELQGTEYHAAILEIKAIMDTKLKALTIAL